MMASRIQAFGFYKPTVKNGMRIGLFGATGAVGRALLVHMLTSNVLAIGDEIVLISRGNESNHLRLLAIATDLSDGFDLRGVKLSICWDLESLAALDVFVMTAGATIGRQITQRPQLASANFQLFQDVAKALRNHCPDAFFLIISNPVELAVKVFCEYLNRRRVVVWARNKILYVLSGRSPRRWTSRDPPSARVLSGSMVAAWCRCGLRCFSSMGRPR